MCWSYEEEVRVVKNIFEKDDEDNFLSDISYIHKDGDHELFIFELPPDTIKEVYLGLRNPLYYKKDKLKSLIDRAREYSKNIKFYECRQEDSSWYINSRNIIENISSLK